MASTRIITGLAITVALILGVFIRPLNWILYLFLAFMAMGGALEYGAIASRAHSRVIRLLAVVFIAAFLLDAFFYDLSHFIPLVILSVTIVSSVYILLLGAPGCVSGIAATFYAIFWTGLAGALGFIILKREGGPYILGFIMAVVSMTDTGAYFVGSALGKHKLCPRLSPKKSIEGALGGVATAVLVAALCQIILGFVKLAIFSWLEVIVLGIVFSILGQLGDLVESGFKRDGSVKDSGTIIKGHGGILDLTDSLIFCLPLMFLYLEYIK